MLERGFGIYPVEGSIYAIEVKSKLTATEIKTTIEKAKRLQALKYAYQEKGDFYPLQISSPTPVITCIFAFNTDLAPNGKSEIERYRELDPGFNTSPSIKIICVSGRGYWHYWRGGASPIWVQHNPTDEYDEILDFVGGVANTIPTEILKRGGPSFGYYILKEDKSRITGLGQ